MDSVFKDRVLKKTLSFTGIKHSGKSTFGKQCASYLNVTFADSDDLLLNQYNERNSSPFSSVRDLYREKGKNIFMEYELLGIKHFFENLSSSGILSLGGGIIDNEAALLLLKKESFILFLDVPEETLYSRIISKGVPPFLDAANPEKSFSHLYSLRKKRYTEIADIILKVGNKSVPESIEYIFKRLLEDENVWKQHR